MEDWRPCGETEGRIAELKLHGGLEAVLRTRGCVEEWRLRGGQ